MRRADGLIAISENTRQDAIRILGLAPERVEAIYPGIADSFFRANSQLAAAMRARHGLERPYLLFLGTIEPRKNVSTLLDAYAALNGSLREEYELVLAGPPGWGDDALLRRLRNGSPGVRYLGYVPETDLAGLTAGATAFVYPSLYEGFGFPVAQAMACGVPVITSNESSLKEIAGDAAVLVDPRSASELRGAIERLLGSAALRQSLGAEGRRRAASYTWRECALRTLRFFERVAG
jgi:glycosyltransferase involved in cell wall biosynthesis